MMRARLFLAIAMSLLLATPARSARPVDEGGVIAALETALARAGAGENLEVEPRRADLVRRLMEGGHRDFAAEILHYDPTKHRFTALVRPAGASDGNPVRLSGRFYEIIELPVLRRPVPKGRTLSDADLDWRPFRLERIGADVVEDTTSIAGMTATRRLAAGRPLRARDLSRPVMVSKGAVVTMVLDAPGISLGALGRTLKSGAAGEIIPVMNLRSKRTIEAQVTSPTTVRIPNRAGRTIR